MAAKLSNLKWPPLVALLVLLAGMVGITFAGNMAMYWGQNGDAATMADVCNSGLYTFVLLPRLNTTGILRANRTDLSADIQACQSLDVKVLLSVGGGSSSAISVQAQTVDSKYLWHNFLGGNSSSRPLGNAVLDGINFDTETGDVARYEALANSLSQLSAQGHGRKLYLTAAPQRPYPAAVKIANLHNFPESSFMILHNLGLRQGWRRGTRHIHDVGDRYTWL
ncbi:hypothetical protein SETIT_5G251500v2 [Setaria italica]|uniref:chitinase n=1 Tax=Setaria italica TaxID=4555 RepID=A0A368R8P9_SETIT|nr:hypothetical protein SETIT_5G251500v2 [Setaria italica]